MATKVKRGKRADPQLAALGALIRELRERLGISQRQLAKQAGFPHHFIHRLEAGMLPQLDLRDAAKLANFLGCSLETIAALTGADVVSPQTDGELSRQLATIEKSLDDEQRQKLATQLEPIFAYWQPSAASDFQELVKKHFSSLVGERKR